MILIPLAFWILVACVSIVRATRNKYPSADELYRVMGRSLGDVGRAYTDAEALAKSLDHEASNPRAQSGEDSVKMGCVDYEGGSTIAKFYGELVNTFFVSRKEDLLCFFYVAKASTDSASASTMALEADLNIVSPIPMGAKVDKDLYDILETPWEQIQGLLNSLKLNGTAELSIEYFDFSGNERRAVPASSQERHRSLQDYNLADIDTFTEVQMDEARRLMWTQHRSRLASALSPSAGAEDPCGFIELFADGVQMRDQMLFLPATEFLQASDATGQACLALIAAAAALDPQAAYVSLATTPEPMNMRARSSLQVGATGQDETYNPFTAWGLKGDKEVASMADTGLDDSHCFFREDDGERMQRSPLEAPITDSKRRKVVQYTHYERRNIDSVDEPGGHGTHVAGTICGDPEASPFDTDGKYAGVAPEAQLAVIDLANTGTGIYVPNTYDLFAPAYNAGARAQCHSWGGRFSSNNPDNQYAFGEPVDDWLYRHQDAVVVYSAGNMGQEGQYSLTREATIKNAISVGAADSTAVQKVAFFSSQGPTYDGRIKPDIVATGHWTTSAKAAADGNEQCDTHAMAGTSMSAPAITGAALLIRQYFKSWKFWKSMCNTDYDNCDKWTPSGVLIKAIILHAGRPMEQYNGINSDSRYELGPTPDSVQGYGFMDLSTTLMIREDLRVRFSDADDDETLPPQQDLFVVNAEQIGEDTVFTYHIHCEDPEVPLRTTLAWYDPPVPGKPSKALLHDLDLMVETPGGKVMYGNGGDEEDDVNVNEQVRVDDPERGTYIVTVTSHSLPVGEHTQRFSLVITVGGYTEPMGSTEMTETPATLPVPIYDSILP